VRDRLAAAIFEDLEVFWFQIPDLFAVFGDNQIDLDQVGSYANHLLLLPIQIDREAQNQQPGSARIFPGLAHFFSAALCVPLRSLR
jgi:hypothetical protein